MRKILPKALCGLILTAGVSSAVDLGDFGANQAVAGPDSGSAGTGYLLFNPDGLGEHRPIHPKTAENFCIVKFTGGQWRYYTNEFSAPFLPQNGDLLVAGLNMTTDTVELFEGQSGIVEGIAIGYASGDLAVTANIYAGGHDPGEFGLTGTQIELNKDPVWWTEKGILKADAQAPEPLSPANVGQAKWMASQALEVIRAKHPELADTIQSGLAGPAATHPFSGWPPPVNAEADRSVLLNGQLKSIAAPFYNALHQAAPVWLEHEMNRLGTRQPDSYFPWGDQVGEIHHQGPATIGQLKALFALGFGNLSDRNLDRDQDGLADSWEQQFIGTVFASVEEVLPEEDTDGDYLSNSAEYLLGTDPLVSNVGNLIEPVQWRDLVSAHTNSVASTYGSNIAKDSGARQLWNAGAVGEKTLEGDGGITFRLPTAGPSAMLGLSRVSLGQGYHDLDYAFYRQSEWVGVYERGVRRLTLPNLPLDTQFRIHRADDIVSYYVNDSLVLTSSARWDASLFADCSLYKLDAVVSHIGSFGFSNGDADQDRLPDVWELNEAGDLAVLDSFTDHDRDFLPTITEYHLGTSPFAPDDDVGLPLQWNAGDGVDVSYQADSRSHILSKISNRTPWNASVSSSSVLLGDGAIKYRRKNQAHFVSVGLSEVGSNVNSDYKDIGFGLLIDGNNRLTCREGKDTKGHSYTLGSDDVLEVRRTAGVITYHRNGVLLHTSGLTTHEPLIVDTSFYTGGAVVDHIVGIGFTTEDDDIDSDSDGLADWFEASIGSDLSNPDSDGDGIADGEEIKVLRSNPLSLDSDNDGLPDSWEYQHGLAILDSTDRASDIDDDRLPDIIEFQIGTDPTDKDTDDDYVSDGIEYYGF